jgi:type IV pilus assembly protein PilC
VNFRPYFLAGIAGLFAIALGIYLWSRSAEGAVWLDKARLKLPFIGETWIKFQVAQFVRTLSTLLTGGTPLVQSLDTAADSITSRLVREAVQKAAQLVKEGQPFHIGMQATGIMPELALEMIEVGEASGALPAMLNSVAEFYEEDVNVRLGMMVTIIEPAILVFMAVFVLFILLALYLPIFSFSLGSQGG